MPEIKKCIELFDLGIFHDSSSALREAAFIQLMINLNDVLQFLNTKNKRITFSAHIKQKEGKKIDITDLVNSLRNAVCHNTSNNRNISNCTLSFCIIRGKTKAIKFGDISIGTEFEDDIAYVYGEHMIYLKRHIYYLLRKLPNICKDVFLEEKGLVKYFLPIYISY